MKQNVKEALYAYFKTKTDKSLSDTDNLFNNGFLDSMGVLELVNYLESSLEVEVDADDISEANFKTIDAITVLVERNLK